MVVISKLTGSAVLGKSHEEISQAEVKTPKFNLHLHAYKTKVIVC